MGTRVGNSYAMATGILAPQCHKTVAKSSLIKPCVTASKIITANVSSIAIGLWGKVSHLSFIHCLWRELFQSQSKDISHHNRLLYCNNSWHHQSASSVLMKIWWNEFQQQHFFPPSIACEWGLPERKSPLITMYNILYSVFWNANDKASSHKSLLEWVY